MSERLLLVALLLSGLSGCSDKGTDVPQGQLPSAEAPGLYYADEDTSDGPGYPDPWPTATAPDADGDFQLNLRSLTVEEDGSWQECDSVITYEQFHRVSAYPSECAMGTWRRSGDATLSFTADHCLLGTRLSVQNWDCAAIDAPSATAESLLGTLNFGPSPVGILKQRVAGGPVNLEISAPEGSEHAGKAPRQYTRM